MVLEKGKVPPSPLPQSEIKIAVSGGSIKLLMNLSISPMRTGTHSPQKEAQYQLSVNQRTQANSSRCTWDRCTSRTRWSTTAHWVGQRRLSTDLLENHTVPGRADTTQIPVLFLLPFLSSLHTLKSWPWGSSCLQHSSKETVSYFHVCSHGDPRDSYL